MPPEQNADFVCAMEDVLEVYQRPYDPQRPVLCFDEQSRQLTKERVGRFPPRRGVRARVDYEYERNGTANLFMIFEPLAGKCCAVKVTDRRTALDFAEVIRELVDSYPRAEKIVLVMDNLNTHKMASLYEAFVPDQARRLIGRLEVHYTPKHGSWLDMAETELSVMTEAVPATADSRQTYAGPGSCRMGRLAKQRSLPSNRLAFHHRKRPNQTQTPLPVNSGRLRH